MKLVLFGLPGAGKGTVAERLSNEKSYLHISTGELFRDAIKNETELGKKVKESTASGELVPDELTVALVEERLSADDVEDNILLDGFPRTVSQAKSLAGLTTIDRVINFTITDQEVVERLTGRRTCKAAGHIYHIKYMPPKTANVCDHDGSELYTRSDDTIESVMTRLEVYREQTLPLIDFYRVRGLLADIHASKKPEDVYSEVLSLIGEA